MTAALNLRHAIGEMRAIALVEALLRALAQRQAFDHRTDTRFGVVGALQVARLERVGLAGIGETFVSRTSIVYSSASSISYAQPYKPSPLTDAHAALAGTYAVPAIVANEI